MDVVGVVFDVVVGEVVVVRAVVCKVAGDGVVGIQLQSLDLENAPGE